MSVRRVEWSTITLVAATYAGWLAAGLWLWPRQAVLALVAMAVLAALHSSLIHEAVHGHPTRNAAVNELLLFWPLAIVWPYRRFRTLHLRHHNDSRLTDALEDPESAFFTGERYDNLPAPIRGLRRLNNTLPGRLVFGPLLGAHGLVCGDAKLIAAREPGIARAWMMHLAGAASVLLVVHTVFAIPIWLYALTVAWPANSLILIRSFAEHRWALRPQERSVIVERSPFAYLFLFNNLHAVHHAHPGAPWHTLPAKYRAQRAFWADDTGGYVVSGYWALLRPFILRPRGPMIHPADDHPELRVQHQQA